MLGARAKMVLDEVRTDLNAHFINCSYATTPISATQAQPPLQFVKKREGGTKNAVLCSVVVVVAAGAFFSHLTMLRYLCR